MLQAGSFTSDGLGNITNGLMDSSSRDRCHTSNLSFTGTYSIGRDQHRPHDAGHPGPGEPLSFQVAVPASGTIRFIQNGNAGDQGTGVIRKVTSATKVTISSLAAYWAFGVRRRCRR